jgi:hypothetical protein
MAILQPFGYGLLKAQARAPKPRGAIDDCDQDCSRKNSIHGCRSVSLISYHIGNSASQRFVC